MTDGYVIRNYDGIAIQISIRDRYILEKMAKELGESTSLRDIKSKKISILGHRIKSGSMTRLSAYCPEMATDLKKHGLVTNKTLCLKFPKKIKRMSHFIRGVMDGDGSIGFHSKNGFPWARLTTASPYFADGFCRAMDREGFSFNFSGKNVLSCYQVGGKNSILDFYEWMYNRKDIWYLERKYAKVQNKIYKKNR